MPDLSDQIEQAARDPDQVSVDGVSTKGKPITDLIEADRYLASKEAAQRGASGLRFTKLVPPGGG